MDGLTIDRVELEQLVQDILCSAGVDSGEARIMAEIIVWFNLVGRYTQGVGRLPVYLR